MGLGSWYNCDHKEIEEKKVKSESLRKWEEISGITVIKRQNKEVEEENESQNAQGSGSKFLV